MHAFCCIYCCYRAGIEPKTPYDYEGRPYKCDCCGTYGPGSMMNCVIGEWLRVRPLPWPIRAELTKPPKPRETKAVHLLAVPLTCNEQKELT